MQTSSPQKMWTWIPSLFFLEGIPYVVVTTISVMLLKRLGEDNTHIAFFTSLLYLPWVIKPLWQAPIQRIHTRWRICATQIIISATLAIMAYAVTTPKSMPLLLTSLWIVAFASAFHDEASDNKKICAYATSSGLPKRPNGNNLIFSFRSSSVITPAVSKICVCTIPGFTQLTRIP